MLTERSDHMSPRSLCNDLVHRFQAYFQLARNPRLMPIAGTKFCPFVPNRPHCLLGSLRLRPLFPLRDSFRMQFSRMFRTVKIAPPTLHDTVSDVIGVCSLKEVPIPDSGNAIDFIDALRPVVPHTRRRVANMAGFHARIEWATQTLFKGKARSWDVRLMVVTETSVPVGVAECRPQPTGLCGRLTINVGPESIFNPQTRECLSSPSTNLSPASDRTESPTSGDCSMAGRDEKYCAALKTNATNPPIALLVKAPTRTESSLAKPDSTRRRQEWGRALFTHARDGTLVWHRGLQSFGVTPRPVSAGAGAFVVSKQDSKPARVSARTLRLTSGCRFVFPLLAPLAHRDQFAAFRDVTHYPSFYHAPCFESSS